MKTITLPYHKENIEFELEEKYIESVLVSKSCDYESGKSEDELVEEALSNPIGSAGLEELAAGKKSMVIITGGHTDPTPSCITLPALLRRVRRVNHCIDITILVATGAGRVSEYEELLKKLGGTIIRHEKIIVHDSRKTEDMASLGTPDSGMDAEVNKLIKDADLLIAEGYIAPHVISGFTGGCDSILPGVASMRCITANQCANISNPYAKVGVIENNPVYSAAKTAAQRSGLQFILNVVLNDNKEIIKAFAGHFDEAHQKGCEFAAELACVEAKTADIVVTSNGGFPLDQSIFQAVEGIAAAEPCCKEGGVIIQAASCRGGHGCESFYETFKSAASPKAVSEKTYAPETDGLPEALLLSRVLEKHKVIMVAYESQKDVIKDMFMDYAASIDEALSIAREYKGKDAKITVIPNGTSVIVTAL